MNSPLLPIRVFGNGQKAMVDLAVVEEPFDDPFFDDTVSRALSRPVGLLSHREVRLAELDPEPADAVPLAGLIFHLSRCGSTLVSQMLKNVPELLVLSEPSLLDAAVDPRAPWAADDDSRAQLLRTLVRHLIRQRRPGQSRAVLKLNAWHALQLSLYERAFPGVPWVFLYREPLMVLVANLDLLGGRMLPGTLAPELTGLDLATAASLPLESYMAHVLARLAEAPLARLGKTGQLHHYRELPDAVWTKIAPHFGVVLDAAAKDGMRQTRSRHAKYPHRPFQDDTALKLSLATEQVRAACAVALDGVYARLEATRRPTAR